MLEGYVLGCLGTFRGAFRGCGGGVLEGLWSVLECKAMTI